MQVKLTDGRTGILLDKNDKVANITIDNGGGTQTIALSDITEFSSSANVKPEIRLEKPPVPEPAEKAPDFGMTVDLLEPVFVRAIIKAIQNPATQQAIAGIFPQLAYVDLKELFSNAAQKEKPPVKKPAVKKTVVKKK